MTEVRIAAVQFAPTADAAANRDRIAALSARAAGAGARLVVFPEYSSFFTPRLGEPVVEAAEPLDGPFVSALAALADRHGVTIVAGMAETVPAGPDGSRERRFRNTVVALAPGAGLVARYRKAHLYDAFGQRESDWVRAGELEDAATFEVDGVAVGLQTCYDLRFPESTRLLADAGARLVVVPAEWVAGDLKVAHWRTLLAARAIENTLYVAAADHPGPVGVGHSAIIDPRGVELALVEDGEGIASAAVDPGEVDRVRAVNPSLAARRYAVVPR